MSKKKSDVQNEVQGAIEKEKFDKETKKAGLDGFDQISVKMWKPAPTEFIMGVYDGCILFEPEDPTKKKGEKDVFIQFIIDDESKDRVSFIPGQTVDKLLVSEKVVKGDILYCAFEGQDTTAAGNPVNLWDIRIKRK